jgi:hypothetical protein
LPARGSSRILAAWEEHGFERDRGRVTTDALGRLQDLLKDLFQFESKELDFGIYRIMNHKRGEIGGT